jgi:hypothetical protein
MGFTVLGLFFDPFAQEYVIFIQSFSNSIFQDCVKAADLPLRECKTDDSRR